MASNDFKEVKICGRIFYLDGGILYDRKDSSCLLEPISQKDLVIIILVLNSIILESEC